MGPGQRPRVAPRWERARDLRVRPDHAHPRPALGSHLSRGPRPPDYERREPLRQSDAIGRRLDHRRGAGPAGGEPLGRLADRRPKPASDHVRLRRGRWSRELRSCPGQHDRLRHVEGRIRSDLDDRHGRLGHKAGDVRVQALFCVQIQGGRGGLLQPRGGRSVDSHLALGLGWRESAPGDVGQWRGARGCLTRRSIDPLPSRGRPGRAVEYFLGRW